MYALFIIENFQISFPFSQWFLRHACCWRLVSFVEFSRDSWVDDQCPDLFRGTPCRSISFLLSLEADKNVSEDYRLNFVCHVHYCLNSFLLLIMNSFNWKSEGAQKMDGVPMSNLFKCCPLISQRQGSLPR